MDSRRFVAAFLAVICAACSGGSKSLPTAPTVTPSPNVVPPAPTLRQWTLIGRVVSNPGITPIPGANVIIQGFGPTHTDANGVFQISGESANPYLARLTISAGGFLTRETGVRLGDDKTVEFDLISLAAPFRMDFLRQFARVGFEGNTGDGTLQRWNASPNFYFKTTDASGAAIPPEWLALDYVVSEIRRLVPLWSAGKFGAGTVEIGSEPAGSQRNNGWIKVEFLPNEILSFGGMSGRAQSGSIRFGLVIRDGPICPGRPGFLKSSVIAHELGHAMGYLHTLEPTPGAIMSYYGFPAGYTGATFCDVAHLSDLERHHAAVVYSRPVGQREPDIDPDGFELQRIR